ncbi:LysM peptidoglycan-binding domain-containing protein [Streptomyces olivaceus]|uniref:LysM peptidoglycan-binding domain-containing protein n=1 Tax=Streptomyces olivaceus TaxID=47716 RepID=UPI0022EE1157|nr:transglycosylase family protein [Streptomyces olivaceus]GHI90576.1 peptidoglycan-binding protein LysM [Streptomyces olivaceus]
MLSGNGRHRRPRQAPALVVAAGVTGSAIAIPLLGATGAHAADASAWDQIAQCETGGAWSQNNGNGYSGGLQLSQEVWEQYGGLEYASSADQASRSQQIRVAEKLYADQGIAAWPTCGLLAGLGNDSGILDGGSDASGDDTSKDSDTSGDKDETKSPGSGDATGSSESPQSSESPSPSGATEESPSPSGTPSSSPSPSSPSSSSSSSSSGTPSADSSTERDQSDKSGTSAGSSPSAGVDNRGGQGATSPGRHRGDSANEGADTAKRGLTDWTGGRHASSGGSGEGDDSYIVRSGDNLWGIADSLGVDGGWHALYGDN